MTATTTPTTPEGTTADELAGRLLSAAVGTADILAIHLGDRLGWYDALAAGGPLTPQELAEATGSDERYAREWLEQQAVSDLLTVTDDAGTRRFGLSPASREVLTDRTSLAYLTPLAHLMAAAAGQLPSLAEAYRTGGGVSWSQFGADARLGQADMNRPWYERALAPALAGVPELHALLGRTGARLADVGCGEGWSAVALAAAYPSATVDGVDPDEPSVAAATDHARDAGLADRVRFRVGDAAEDLPPGTYDAVFAFECLHDMPHPVAVLRAAREALGPGGRVVVMDEAAADTFTAPGDEVERLLYGFSTLLCLPDGRAHGPSAATGTVIRADTVRAYAREAGFAAVDVLPIEDFGFWRFYLLTP